MAENNFSIASIRSLLKKKGWIDIPSTGISMYPLIKKGNVCRFVPLDEENNLKKGEIALFMCENGRLIGHRYYRSFVENGVYYYLFKGDTNVCHDPPVEQSQLIGKLTLIKKRKISLNPEGAISKIWASAVLTFPVLPRYCKKYLSFKSRLRI